MAAPLVLASLSMSAALVAAQESSVDCAVAYTTAYMSALNGECSQRDCTPGCQQKIDAVRSTCVGTKYNVTDPITGIIAERSFVQGSMPHLQDMGPVDCDYHSPGAPRCDESLCTVEHVAEVTGRDCLGQ